MYYCKSLHLVQNRPQLERQSSLPDVSLHQQQQPQQASNSPSSPLPPVGNAKTRSLPRSGSGLSGSVGEQLGSTASGYAATGSENSIDNRGMPIEKSSSQARELPTTASVAVASSLFPATGTAENKASASIVTAAGNSRNGRVAITRAQMEEGLNHQPSQVNSQLSYPLQKLLAQPLSFDIESDDLEELLDPQHGVNFHQHGNEYHQYPHSHSNQVYHQHANSRTRGGTVPADYQHQSRRGLHGNQVPHHSLNLDRIRLPNHAVNHHVSFNPGGRSVRTSRPGLPSISAAVPPPPHFGGITVDIDV